eukprot:gnl/Trimastix_PCT/1163.p1 GENE.gnl/Trimastix_PCT/1163~~gnl/Trimastix_PCT/1163.p1  ORF type:complete len:870 (-),score=316.21 gnl/Trimastix_PCT/1163:3902-6289(-)
MAGLILKNALYSKTPERQAQLTQQWLTLDQQVRAQIKAMTLRTLASSFKEARHTAAQAVARIGVIEIPYQQWNELVNELLNNMKVGDDNIKQATLDCLGYLCEDMPGQHLSAISNPILTAVVSGMVKDQPNEDIRFSATTALFNALEFARKNFENERERNYIMQVILETTQCQVTKIRTKAFECLVKVASLYYQHLPVYMEALFSLTLNAIKSDAEEVAQMALEFWSTISEEEIDIAFQWEDYERDREGTEMPTRSNAEIIKRALQFLIPVVTEALAQRDEHAEPDEWNKSMAAGNCLSLFAQNVRDVIVDHVMPFIRDHINHENWALRNAAVLAFGSILEGPSADKLGALVEMGLPRMIAGLKDQHIQVKDTCAWTIGQICELHWERIGDKMFQLMSACYECLTDEPRVANNLCWAVHNLAKATYEDGATTSAIAHYFPKLFERIMETTEREDADECNLRSSAYSALNVMVQCSTPDVHPAIIAKVPVFLDRLQATFAREVLSQEDRDEQQAIQAAIVGLVQVIYQTVGEQIQAHIERIMQMLHQLVAAKNATLHEEVLLCMGTMITLVGDSFDRYMPAFLEFLSGCLQNYQAPQVVECAIGVLGDSFRCMEANAAQYADGFVSLMLEALKNQVLDRKVKPSIFSTLGDAAMSMGSKFIPHLSATMTLCRDASRVDMDNIDFVDYLNELREGIFDCYTGILQGLRHEKQGKQFMPYVESVVAFISIVAQDIGRYDGVTRASCGVIGDMAMALGSEVRAYLHREFIRNLIRDAMQSDDESTRSIAEWTKEAIKPL